MVNKISNIFSIDWEDWYHANYPYLKTPKLSQSIIQDSTNILLSLLSKHNTKATFFIVTSLAEKHPDLIKKILSHGHEIASHSHNHQLVYKLNLADFEKDLEKSISVIHNLTGKRPAGYRAPSWSVSTEKTPWFWKTLKKHGFTYSSSRMPFENQLYGDRASPTIIHTIDNLLEIPPSTTKILNKNIPYSGGFYLRLFPFQAINYYSKKKNIQNTPNVFYIHPREVLTSQPKLPLRQMDNFIHYHNLSSTLNKLDNILKNYSCTSFEEYLKNRPKTTS